MFKLYFLLLFSGHVIADFYVQTGKMAENKEKSLKTFLLHCLYYWSILVFVCLPVISWETVLGATIASGLHCIIDAFKSVYLIQIREKNKDIPAIRRNLFFTDQILHIISLIFISYLLAGNVSTFRGWGFLYEFFDAVGISERKFIAWTLALLLIHKPANISIQNLLTVYRPKSIVVSKNNNAGRFIGTLERVIILIFISIGQYSAIGLVLTAKSIARYERISKEKEFAEYFLLGTLLSTVFAVIVSLGLIKMTT